MDIMYIHHISTYTYHKFGKSGLFLNFSRGAENKSLIKIISVDINFITTYINDGDIIMSINNIKSYRVQKRISQWKLASKLGLTAPMVSVWERGYRTPSEAQKKGIATALGTTVSAVFPAVKGDEF